MSATTELKSCSTCKTERPASDYHRSRTTNDGLDPRCKPCRKTATASHTIDQARRRSGQNLRLYGITAEELEAMRLEQHDLCAICHEPETMTYRGRPKTLSVDHCHDTGKVRGLLCAACNFALGKFKDNPALLRSAADYLER